MNLFGSGEVNQGQVNKISKVNVSSPIQNSEEINLNFVQSESGVKSVQLDDFFELLDTKTVQKIMETSQESKQRIINDVAQREYETDGARAILNSLG